MAIGKKLCAKVLTRAKRGRNQNLTIGTVLDSVFLRGFLFLFVIFREHHHERSIKPVAATRFVCTSWQNLANNAAVKT